MTVICIRPWNMVVYSKDSNISNLASTKRGRMGVKIRSGFVSNSSSSSFVIKLEHLLPHQIVAILRHKYSPECSDPWDIGISTKTGEVWGHTSMDNFDMDMYLDKLEVRPSDIDWDVADHYDVTYWDKMED